MNTIEDIAKQAAGNWRRFDSFAWHRPENADNYTIVYTHNRDSKLLEESNANAIAIILQPYIDNGEILEEHHNHWLCGWIDGYAIPVYNQDNTITKAFKAWCEIQERIDDYPVLDEDDYIQHEYEATLWGIKDAAHWEDIELSDEQVKDIYRVLSDNELESSDDAGGYPSGDAIRAACQELGIQIK